MPPSAGSLRTGVRHQGVSGAEGADQGPGLRRPELSSGILTASPTASARTPLGLCPGVCPRPGPPPPRPPGGGPTWHTLVFVFLEVPVQVGLLPEAAVAQVALEGLLLVVDVAHVALQVRGDAEGAVTVFASEKQTHSRFTSRPRVTTPDLWA